jgi:type IV pilus assembly protein PilM
MTFNLRAALDGTPKLTGGAASPPTAGASNTSASSTPAPDGPETAVPKAKWSARGGGGMFNRAITPVGVDIGTRRLKVAVLQAGEKTPRVTRLFETPLPKTMVTRDGIVDPSGLTDELVHFSETAKLNRVVATLVVGGQDVFIKRLTVQRMKKDELIRTLPTNAALKLPTINLDETKLDIEILDPTSQSVNMQAMVVAAKKEAIRVRQKVVIDAGWDLDGVDIDAFALFNIFEYCYPERVAARMTLLHVGHESTLIVVAEGGAPMVCRQVDIGIAKLIDNLISGGIVTADEAEKSLFSGANPAAIYPDGVNAWAEELMEEVRRSASAVRGTPETGPRYLSGGGALIEGVAGTLQEQSEGGTVTVFDPLAVLPRSDALVTSREHEGALYAIALGLVIRQVSDA